MTDPGVQETFATDPVHAGWWAALRRLAALMPGYEARDGQLRMMSAVSVAQHDKRDLVVEAGTGTGKTLAYLLPLLASGKRMVLSTATRQLQEQLVRHDLPTALGVTGSAHRVALLKGRRNYLCIERSNATIRRELQLVGFLSPELQSVQFALLRSDAGDINQVTGVEDSSAIWSDVTSTADNCLGQDCPAYQECFVVRARREAQEADVVVVNHHLLFADYAIKERFEGQGLLPSVDAIVIDEAHALEDVATRFFGRSVSSSRFEQLRREVSGVLSELEAPDAEVDPLFAHLRRAQQSCEELFTAAAKWESKTRLDTAKLDALFASSQALTAACLRLSAALANIADDEGDLLRTYSAGIVQFAEDLQHIVSPDQDDEVPSVRWVEVRARSVALTAYPLEVAPILQRTLLSEAATRLFTSATLAVREDFSAFVSRLGLPPETETLRVPGAFDYGNQALLYLPTHLPAPFAEGREHAVSKEIIRLVQASGGGAFALFSSYRGMRSAYYRAQDQLGAVNVLLQGQESRERLLERFRAEQPAVLFATMGFWQGVDLPGDVLRLVMIDKIPFPPPDDPLFAARSDKLKTQGRSSFSALSIPSAAIALRQGFGRLIRSTTDRGVVALLDPRVVQRSYGRVLLSALPPARRVKRFEAIEAFYSDEA